MIKDIEDFYKEEGEIDADELKALLRGWKEHIKQRIEMMDDE